jgi:hypothetical protein
MSEVKTASKKKKTKQKFVYFMDSRWTSFGPGLDYVNEDEVVVPPVRTILPDWDYMGPRRFRPMAAVPILKFAGEDSKYFDDFEKLGSIWILSAPVRAFFESLDAPAFDFRPCKTLMPDGSPGPERSLALVTRLIDALDRERSECKPNYYDDIKGLTMSISPLEKNYFYASVVRDHDFFTVPHQNSIVFVSQRVKDEFKKQGWRGAEFRKAYLT